MKQLKNLLNKEIIKMANISSHIFGYYKNFNRIKGVFFVFIFVNVIGHVD